MKLLAYVIGWAWGLVDKAFVDGWLWYQDRQVRRTARRELRRKGWRRVW